MGITHIDEYMSYPELTLVMTTSVIADKIRFPNLPQRSAVFHLRAFEIRRWLTTHRDLLQTDPLRKPLYQYSLFRMYHRGGRSHIHKINRAI